MSGCIILLHAFWHLQYIFKIINNVGLWVKIHHEFSCIEKWLLMSRSALSRLEQRENTDGSPPPTQIKFCRGQNQLWAHPEPLGPWSYHSQCLYWCPWPIWHQRPYRCPGSRLQLVVMRVSKVHAPARAKLIWVACAVTWGHGVIRARTDAEGLVWVHAPTAARVWVDVCGICSSWGSCGWLRSCWCPRTTMLPV